MSNQGILPLNTTHVLKSNLRMMKLNTMASSYQNNNAS